MNNLTEYLNRVEDLAVDVLAVFGPWLAPIPSAYLVGKATFSHLHWHEVIAGVAAVAVESIGVVSIILSLRLYEWNQTKNKTDPAAPLPLALFAAVFYFVVTIGLTVVLDVHPEWSKYAPAIFPLLAAIGAANIAMKNGQRRRERAKAEAKTGRKTSHEKPARKRQDTRRDNGILPTDWRQLSRQQRHVLAGSTREERENMFPELADRTRREWHSRLDKIAANGSSNGHV